MTRDKPPDWRPPKEPDREPAREIEPEAPLSETQELLMAYVDDEMDPEQRADFQQRLADEPELAAEAAEFKAKKVQLTAEMKVLFYEHYVEELAGVVGVTGKWEGRKNFNYVERHKPDWILLTGDDTGLKIPKALEGVTVPTDLKAVLENLAKGIVDPGISPVPTSSAHVAVTNTARPDSKAVSRDKLKGFS